ncbi:unnamed protein product [Durusdinium trenchii]|uniref:Acyl-ACP thioesterase-like C-terminal domain-containing protein n=1 Tax=Durusdinium trenchii TaxID=1381693 RepID=A0ABP0Q0X1_9DINO
MNLIANYVDFSAHQCLPAVLRWCDTAGIYPLSLLDAETRAQLLETWSRYSVMRSIQMEVHVRGHQWERLLANSCTGTMVRVQPMITRLGRTSYTVRNEVTSSSLPLATVETVMVQLDESLSKSVPLSCSEQLKSILKPQSTATGIRCPVAGKRPSACFSWGCEVRPSDCDLLGHMNNASYITLVEDARRAAGLTFDVQVASIEYLLQAKAFELLQIALWRDQPSAQGQSVIGYEMKGEQGLVARGSLVSFLEAKL